MREASLLCFKPCTDRIGPTQTLWDPLPYLHTDYGFNPVYETPPQKHLDWCLSNWDLATEVKRPSCGLAVSSESKPGTAQ